MSDTEATPIEDDWQSKLTNPKERLIAVYNNKYYADMKFLVGEEEKCVLAHTWVLCLCSPVFSSWYSIPTNEGMIEIKLPNVSVPVFESILKYVYLDLMPTGNEKEIRAVLKAAETFELVYLKEVCENRLLEIAHPI